MEVDCGAGGAYGTLEPAATGALVAVVAPVPAPPQALTRAIERIASAALRNVAIT